MCFDSLCLCTLSSLQSAWGLCTHTRGCSRVSEPCGASTGAGEDGWIQTVSTGCHAYLGTHDLADLIFHHTPSRPSLPLPPIHQMFSLLSPDATTCIRSPPITLTSFPSYPCYLPSSTLPPITHTTSHHTHTTSHHTHTPPITPTLPPSHPHSLPSHPHYLPSDHTSTDKKGTQTIPQARPQEESRGH